jgi:hypothetical protein
MLGKSVSCAGLTFASGRFVGLYLEAMIDSMRKAKCRKLGIDQGTHNFLVHTNILPEARLTPFHNPYVINMHHLPSDASVEIVEDVAFINASGVLTARVVWHQYDRHPTLVQFAQSHYSKANR